MTASERDLPLAWFLGPKAENGPLFEELLLEVLRDYLHWRRNYFPGDPILVSRALQRDLVPQTDGLVQHLHTLLADLRRNFPFYSPRYFGYQLSDTQMPSMLGYIAGMLFNPNNVTPGAAPVTTEMEILACNALLHMLGLRPPPPPPPPGEDAERYYRRAAEQLYGWAHLTSGGTVANIEALWVARQVRYAAPAIKSVARARGLRITVDLPSSGTIDAVDIRELEDRALILLPVPEAIDLLSSYVRALREDPSHAGLSGEQLGRAAWSYLRQSPMSIDRGVGGLFSRHPPVLLVAGTRHYSITKAADVIGIGAGNVVHVRTDSQFRMDMQDLRRQLTRVLREGRVPLAVIASAGTTEEGSVDPVHEVLEVRRELEEQHNASFWLHVDAAWSGYIRSLFSVEGEEGAALAEDPEALCAWVQRFTSDRMDDPLGGDPIDMAWPSAQVGRAFAAFGRADSITIDPHKLGYAPYPCGCIAFADDRVRMFVQQRAPYVSVGHPDPLIHVPPRHSPPTSAPPAATSSGNGHVPPHPVMIDSFSPFILEGSKPGAAASALWLSLQAIPPTPRGHGLIIRESLLAARRLHEWLSRWEGIENGAARCRFVTLTSQAPDTNIVTFVVLCPGIRTLAAANALNEAIYHRFSIQTELGQRDAAYSQPFFLSHTHMEAGEYPADTMEPFFARAGLGAGDFPRDGLFVLRATVMSPYTEASRRHSGQDFSRELVEELAKAAAEIAGARTGETARSKQ